MAETITDVKCGVDGTMFLTNTGRLFACGRYVDSVILFIQWSLSIVDTTGPKHFFLDVTVLIREAIYYTIGTSETALIRGCPYFRGKRGSAVIKFKKTRSKKQYTYM